MAALQPDFVIEMELGERQPAVFVVKPDAGDTATITVAPSYNLLDGTGLLLHGGIAITDYTSLPDAQPQAVVDFYAGAYSPALTAGEYYLQATLVVQGSDGRINVLTPVCLVRLSGALPVPAIVATYNDALLASVPLFQLRKRLSDTDVTNAQFSDNELLYYLQQTGNVVLLAAAEALEDHATDAAYLAVVAKNEGLSTDLTKLSGIIAERAARYREIAPVRPVVLSSPAVFTRGDPYLGTIGSLDIW